MADEPPGGKAPVVACYTTRNRRLFRKTIRQLALDYQPQLARQGLTATVDEIVEVIVTGDTVGPVGTIVQHWLERDVLRGVEIIREPTEGQ